MQHLTTHMIIGGWTIKSILAFRNSTSVVVTPQWNYSHVTINNLDYQWQDMKPTSIVPLSKIKKPIKHVQALHMLFVAWYFGTIVATNRSTSFANTLRWLRHRVYRAFDRQGRPPWCNYDSNVFSSRVLSIHKALIRRSFKNMRNEEHFSNSQLHQSCKIEVERCQFRCKSFSPA